MKVLERVGSLLFLIRTLQRPLERLSILASNTSLVLSWSKQVIQFLGSHIRNGGEGGIRTHGTLTRSPVFKTGAFEHSANLPNYLISKCPNMYHFKINNLIFINSYFKISSKTLQSLDTQWTQFKVSIFFYYKLIINK